MKFTDGDLASLKDRLGNVTDTWGLDRLIVRLEAAEKALNGSTHIEVDYPEKKCKACEAVSEWRKASGKTEVEK